MTELELLLESQRRQEKRSSTAAFSLEGTVTLRKGKSKTWLIEAQRKKTVLVFRLRGNECAIKTTVLWKIWIPFQGGFRQLQLLLVGWSERRFVITSSSVQFLDASFVAWDLQKLK